MVDRYLANLDAGLLAAAVRAPLQIMQSRGGICSSATARLRSVRLFLSGPAAGVIGARMVGGAAGLHDLITVDIGGTSCDIALIEDGAPALRSEGRIGGYPVRVSMLDVNSIGAGGGSIAWLDATRGLRVGPQSAGSEPGPACYGRGGNEPTLTDASVVLGYLDPEHFAGGRLKLRPELSRKAIERVIARPLNFTVEQAALGIHRIVNAQVAEGIRLVSIRQGHDPRRFTLLPLGGGGPLHACALAEELGVRRILVPRHPGVLSAAGLLAAPVEHEVSTALPRVVDELDLVEVRRTLEHLDARCRALMAQEKVSAGDIARRYFADVCMPVRATTWRSHSSLIQPTRSQRSLPHSSRRTTEPTALPRRRPSVWSIYGRSIASPAQNMCRMTGRRPAARRSPAVRGFSCPSARHPSTPQSMIVPR